MLRNLLMFTTHQIVSSFGWMEFFWISHFYTIFVVIFFFFRDLSSLLFYIFRHCVCYGDIWSRNILSDIIILHCKEMWSQWNGFFFQSLWMNERKIYKFNVFNCIWFAWQPANESTINSIHRYKNNNNIIKQISINSTN